MIRKERMSRWVMYFSVFGILGAVQYGLANRPVSSALMVLAFLQYPALVFWNGYRTKQSKPETSA